MTGTITRGDQRQLPVDREHQHEGADEGHDGDEQVLRAVMGDLADLLQILGHAGDEMAGLLVVEEAEARASAGGRRPGGASRSRC